MWGPKPVWSFRPPQALFWTVIGPIFWGSVVLLIALNLPWVLWGVAYWFFLCPLPGLPLDWILDFPSAWASWPIFHGSTESLLSAYILPTWADLPPTRTRRLNCGFLIGIRILLKVLDLPLIFFILYYLIWARHIVFTLKRNYFRRLIYLYT